MHMKMKLLIVAAILASTLAIAHEEMGPRIDAWAKGLRNASGEPCCATADAWKPVEVTWDMGAGRYRVMLDGEWIDVPDSAVLNGPNPAGFAMVWTYLSNDASGHARKIIRCFIPGTAG